MGVERKSSIGRKVGTGVAITVLVLVVIGVVCSFTVRSLVLDVESEARGERVLRILKELELNITRSETAAMRFALAKDMESERTLSRLEPEIRSNLSDLNSLMEGEFQFPNLKRHTENWQQRLARVMALAREQGSEPAFALLTDNESLFIRKEFDENIQTLRAEQEALLRQRVDQAERRRQQAGLTIAVEVLLALLMIYTMGRAVVRDLTTPLRRLVAGIEQVGEGKLDYRVEINSTDEVGQLGRAFNRMAEQLEQGRGLRKDAELALQDTNAMLADRVEALRRRNMEIEEMSRLTELLQTALRAEEAYEVVASFGARIFPGTSGTLLLSNASRTFLEAVAGWGTSHSERVFGTEDCWALRRGRAHEATEVEALHCHHFASGTGSTLCVPLVAQGEALGVLCLEGAVEEQLAVTVTEQLSLALATCGCARPCATSPSGMP